jgi:hypothetical protein
MNRSIKKFEEFNDPVDLIVHTKCPDKWLLIDKETGEMYKGNHTGHWDRLEPITKDSFTKQPE